MVNFIIIRVYDMSVEIISAVGEFRYHVLPFWNSKVCKQEYQIVETGDTFKSERGAVRKIMRVLKKRKAEYRETHPKQRNRVKRRRIKPVKNKREVWVELNIQEEQLP